MFDVRAVSLVFGAANRSVLRYATAVALLWARNHVGRLAAAAVTRFTRAMRELRPFLVHELNTFLYLAAAPTILPFRLPLGLVVDTHVPLITRAAYILQIEA